MMAMPRNTDPITTASAVFWSSAISFRMEKGEIFTTSLDNQPYVPIHVLQGEREMAADNRSLAKFELTGIPPAPRGVPKIQVTFRVDANGILAVEAKDLGSGRTQAVSVRPTSGLNEAEIDRLVGEAQKFKETDELRKGLAELKNQAETLIYTTEQAIEGYSDLLDAERIKSVRGDLATLKDTLESGADIQTIRDAYSRLEAATFAIAEAMYGTAGGDGGPAPA